MNSDYLPDGNRLNIETLESESVKISEISKKGYQFLKENKINDAINCFKKILALDENNNYALVGMGDAARKQGAIREALELYQRCLSCYPGNNYALFGLADCYKVLNQYQKAIGIWEEYLQHDDKNITVLTRIADAYRKVRDFQQSKTVYMRVLEMESENHYAIIGLGHLYYDFKDYKEALYYWEKMLSPESETVDIRVLTSIGNCHRKLKTFDKGIPFFQTALDREPRNFYALFGLADCYRGINHPEKALEYWNRILEQDPRNKMILTRAGDACRSLGDLETAKNFYDSALNVEFDTYAVLGLAMIAKAKGKFEEVVLSLKRLIQQDTGNYRLYIELADHYSSSNDKRGAMEILAEFQRLGIRNQQISEMLERLQSHN
ncbi:MAG: tetratricopeptide repeat protein [Treponema sp.]|jgi:tetratricopeptide (TPR) repeat protein|nr:tetratricopeptide repeat protein [Treponema sp.]